MSIPGSLTPLFNSGGGAGYQISRSLRFNSADSAYLSRTPASAGNRKTWTWSGWVKRSAISFSAEQHLWGVTGTTDATYGEMFFGTGDTLRFAVGYNTTYGITTTRVFRDASGWYHIVLAFDATQSTAANKIKLYINGVEETTFSSDTRSSLANQDWGYNNNVAHYISRQANSDIRHFNGYLADIHFIDGQALTPSSFAEINDTTGQWMPKAYTGSYGTNGFRLDFSDNSNNTATTLGKDYSSNGNNWTPVNLSPFSGTVDSAGGAKPVQNTTDAYGFIAGSGARTDSLSANLQIALPLYTSITDLSPSALATTSTTGNTALTFQTSTFKFYGGSMVSTSTGSSYGTRVNFNSTISLPSGGWTVEFFAKVINISPNGNSIAVKNGSSAILDLYHYGPGNSYLIEVYFNGTSTRISGYNTASNYLDWNHYAICYNGTTATLYINGISAGTNSSNIPTQATNFELAGTGWSGNTSYITDFRIYSTAKYTGNFSIPDRTIAAGNDSLVDTPTSYGTDTGAGGEVRGNYATLNPLDNGGGLTLSNGNLEAENTAASSKGARCTIKIPSIGKWYFEGTIQTLGGSCALGVATSASANPSLSATGTWHILNYAGSGIQSYPGGRGYTFTTAQVGNVLQVAYDADSGKLWFGVNNTWCDGSSGSTGNPGAGTNPTYTSVSDVFPAVEQYTSKIAINFGQRPFAYTAPSGFKALCDTNLPAPVVAKPNTAFDAVPYTGSSGSQNITTNFSPDLVWIKTRNSTTEHELYDTVRGAGVRLSSNVTLAENNLGANGLTSFNSNGFTVPSTANYGINGSGYTYAAWAWDAGSSTVTNTQGSITSQVRANASAGFSIVTFTAQSSGNATIGHGLNVEPHFIIVKSRAQTYSWLVYHKNLASNAYYLVLNSTAAQDNSSNAWNSTTPTSSVFTLGSTYAGGGDSVAYCFAPVAGYSAFGSYTGNGSTTDNTFVYTGMRPRFVMLKRSDSTGNWVVWDAARNSYNVANSILLPNTSAAEYSPDAKIDILSNGFKVRDNSSDSGTNGATYIYAAFAESSFQFSRAR